MNKHIEFVEGEYGMRATIKTAWQNPFLELLLQNNVKELELNIGKGWKSDNLNFLKSLSDLESIIILDQTVKSLDEIHYLRNLKSLNISTYSKTPINFMVFPELINCEFEWIKGSDSLFENMSIQKLFINNYNKVSSEIFTKLIGLKELAVLNSRFKNLQGLGLLKNLKSLRIANLKDVTSLKGIEELYKLEELEIQRCKGINSISEVFKLIQLKRLLLLDLGSIESIKGLENLTKLTTFLFYESTNIIDGDISPVLMLNDLSKISFQNRKHYTHRREDFGKLYS